MLDVTTHANPKEKIFLVPGKEYYECVVYNTLFYFKGNYYESSFIRFRNNKH